MTVLPDSATLSSFGIVLAVILLVTFFLALNIRTIFATLVQSFRGLSTHFSSSIESYINPDTEKHAAILQPSSDPYDLSYKEPNPQRNITASVLLLKNFLISLPSHEAAYGFDLLRPVRVPFYEEKQFSWRKFWGDVLRVLLLPFWVVLVILGYSGYLLWVVGKCCVSWCWCCVS